MVRSPSVTMRPRVAISRRLRLFRQSPEPPDGASRLLRLAPLERVLPAEVGMHAFVLPVSDGRYEHVLRVLPASANLLCAEPDFSTLAVKRAVATPLLRELRAIVALVCVQFSGSQLRRVGRRPRLPPRFSSGLCADRNFFRVLHLHSSRQVRKLNTGSARWNSGASLLPHPGPDSPPSLGELGAGSYLGARDSREERLETFLHAARPPGVEPGAVSFSASKSETVRP